MTAIPLRFGGYQTPVSIHNRAAAAFGDALRERLGASVEFELIGSVLERGRDSAELPGMVASGELACCYMSTVHFTEFAPELRLLELPFLIRNRDAAYRALDGALGARVSQRLLDGSPFRALGFWDNGFRHITNRVRPIRRPEDCRGLRIRTQASELHGEVFRALGFEPIPADIKRFLAEIGGESFDAHDNPLTNIFQFGVQRYHRYLTLTGHFWGAALMVCNERLYRSWPPAVQAAVVAAAREATALQRQLAAGEDEQVLAKLDPRECEVVALTDAERAAFVAAVQPVLARHRRELDPAFLAHFE